MDIDQITNLNEIGLGEETWGKPTPEWHRQNNLLKERLGHAHGYLNSYLHDSELLAFKRTRKSFSFTLSDIQVSRLGCDLLLRAGKPAEYHEFPIAFRFEGLRGIRLCHQDREIEGKLVPGLWRDFKLTRGPTFLYDKVLGADDGIQFALIFWRRRVGHLYVFLSAENLIVEENHRETWIEHFGEDQAWIYDRFDAGRPAPCINTNADGQAFLDTLGIPTDLPRDKFPFIQVYYRDARPKT